MYESSPEGSGAKAAQPAATVSVGSFELFAISLLLCSPSSLGRAWTDGADDTVWTPIVDALPFSEGGKARALEMIEELRDEGLQGDFRKVMNALSANYAEPEPHPGDPPAAIIVQALRQLDQ